MKDFAKSIVCNTKAEAEKVGNFEDPKDAKRYIQMWERRKQDAKSWIDDANRKLKELHKDHGGAFGSLSESEKRSHKAEAQRHEDTIRKYQAEFEKYDNLIKQAQKSTWGNRKCGNAEIVKDGNTWVVLYAEGTKSKEFDNEAEAKKFAAQVGNSKVGNKKIKGSYVTIDTSTGRVTFDDFAGKSFDISRIDSSAGYELRVMQQQINDFKKALEEAKSLAKQNGLI